MTSCAADDRYCVPVTGPIAGEWPANVWPAKEGFVQGGEYLAEAFGIKIGHNSATLIFEKQNEIYHRSEVDSIEVRLDPETIMVPVHALVEVPRDLVYEGTLLMEMWANPHFFRALIDDDYSMPETATNTSAPGQGLDVNTVNVFNDPATDIITFNGARFARPDEIWSQCGIQFRLTGVSVIYTDTEAFKLSPNDGNGALHSLEERVTGGRPFETDDIRLLWGDPPAREEALLTFVGNVDGKKSKGLQYGGVVAVATM